MDRMRLSVVILRRDAVLLVIVIVKLKIEVGIGRIGLKTKI